MSPERKVAYNRDMTTVRYHHGDLRRALIEAALNIIDTEGIESLTIRRLAREVGVSHAAPAHHFADKTAIVMAVAAEGFRLFGEHLSGTMKIADAFERIEEMGRAYCRFAWDHPAYYRLMFGQHGLMGPRGQDPAFSQTAVGSFSILLDAVKPLVYREDMSPEEHLIRTRAASMVAWSSMHGIVSLWQSTLMGYPHREWEGDIQPMVENNIHAIAIVVQSMGDGPIPAEVMTPDKQYELNHGHCGWQAP